MLDSALHFIVLGVILGALYDVFRFFRLVFGSKSVSFILDFVFCGIFALSFFILLLGFNNGSVRALYFTSLFSGFFLYVFTIMSTHCQKQRKAAVSLRISAKKFLKKSKKSLHFIWVMYYNIFVKPLAFTSQKFRKGKRLSINICRKGNSKNERASSNLKTE